MHLDRLAVRYAADCIKAAGAGLGFAAGLYLEQTRLRFSTAARTRTAQAIKLLAGLFSTLLFKLFLSGLGSALLWKAFVYAFLVFWILFLYPALFVFVQKKA